MVMLVTIIAGSSSFGTTWGARGWEVCGTCKGFACVPRGVRAAGGGWVYVGFLPKMRCCSAYSMSAGMAALGPATLLFPIYPLAPRVPRSLADGLGRATHLHSPQGQERDVEARKPEQHVHHLVLQVCACVVCIGAWVILCVRNHNCTRGVVC